MIDVKLHDELIELYEQRDYVSLVQKAQLIDRYNLDDSEIMLLAAAYYHLGSVQSLYFKAGAAFLIPLERSSLNTYPQWHFYMGMCLHEICNYARAFRHFNEFLAMTASFKDELIRSQRKVVENRLNNCQAFLTLPLFNRSFVRRVKDFWTAFDSLIPVLSIYSDRLYHACHEGSRGASIALHDYQSRYREALEQIKLHLGNALPGQKFSLRFLPFKGPGEPRFELIFPAGPHLSRLHALRYLVRAAQHLLRHENYLVCTLGIPCDTTWECSLGGLRVTAEDVMVYIDLRHEDKARATGGTVVNYQIMLYSPRLSGCNDLLRARVLEQLLYHNCGELGCNMYFDEISVLDDADRAGLDKIIDQYEKFVRLERAAAAAVASGDSDAAAELLRSCLAENALSDLSKPDSKSTHSGKSSCHETTIVGNPLLNALTSDFAQEQVRAQSQPQSLAMVMAQSQSQSTSLSRALASGYSKTHSMNRSMGYGHSSSYSLSRTLSQGRSSPYSLGSSLSTSPVKSHSLSRAVARNQSNSSGRARTGSLSLNQSKSMGRGLSSVFTSSPSSAFASSPTNAFASGPSSVLSRAQSSYSSTNRFKTRSTSKSASKSRNKDRLGSNPMSAPPSSPTDTALPMTHDQARIAAMMKANAERAKNKNGANAGVGSAATAKSQTNDRSREQQLHKSRPWSSLYINSHRASFWSDNSDDKSSETASQSSISLSGDQGTSGSKSATPSSSRTGASAMGTGIDQVSSASGKGTDKSKSTDRSKGSKRHDRHGNDRSSDHGRNASFHDYDSLMEELSAQLDAELQAKTQKNEAEAAAAAAPAAAPAPDLAGRSPAASSGTSSTAAQQPQSSSAAAASAAGSVPQAGSLPSSAASAPSASSAKAAASVTAAVSAPGAGTGSGAWSSTAHTLGSSFDSMEAFINGLMSPSQGLQSAEDDAGRSKADEGRDSPLPVGSCEIESAGSSASDSDTASTDVNETDRIQSALQQGSAGASASSDKSGNSGTAASCGNASTDDTHAGQDATATSDAPASAVAAAGTSGSKDRSAGAGKHTGSQPSSAAVAAVEALNDNKAALEAAGVDATLLVAATAMFAGTSLEAISGSYARGSDGKAGKASGNSNGNGNSAAAGKVAAGGTDNSKGSATDSRSVPGGVAADAADASAEAAVSAAAAADAVKAAMDLFQGVQDGTAPKNPLPADVAAQLAALATAGNNPEGSLPHYVCIPLTRLNDFMMERGLPVQGVNFEEYWANNKLDFFSDILYEREPVPQSEEATAIEESIALRLEAFWTVTTCYELEDFMTEFDQSATMSCYEWGILPCYATIPMCNLVGLDEHFIGEDNRIREDRLDELKQRCLCFREEYIGRLKTECGRSSFASTGIALSHEYLFIDFLLWDPFRVMGAVHKVTEEMELVDAGIRSFHPYSNEMAAEDLNFEFPST